MNSIAPGGDFVPATTADIPIIMSLIQQGVEDGSFTQDFNDPFYRAGFERMLRDIIDTGRAPDSDLSGQVRMVRTSIMLHKTHGVKDACLMASDVVGYQFTGKDATKVMMLIVDRSRRGTGIGHQLLDACLSAQPLGGHLFFECMPQSLQMITMLTHRGFQKHVINEERWLFHWQKAEQAVRKITSFGHCHWA